MNLEDAFKTLEGCLLEPILNMRHPNKARQSVIEVQSDSVQERVCGYGATFEEAVIDASEQYKRLLDS